MTCPVLARTCGLVSGVAVERRRATPSERDEIWAKGLEVYPAWKKYEARAGERQIEAFVLSRN